MAATAKKGKTVNAKEFAEWLGISKARVTQLIQEGMPAENSGRKGSPLKINTAEATEWLIAKRAGQLEEKPESQRDRLYRERADEKALANARQRQQLLTRGSVREALLMIATQCATSLDGLPGRLANELATITDARILRERLLFETRDIRRRIARSVSEYITAHGGADPLRLADGAATAKKPRSMGGRKPRTASRKNRRARAVAKR